MVLFQDLSWHCSEGAGWTCSHLNVGSTLKICFQAPSQGLVRGSLFLTEGGDLSFPHLVLSVDLLECLHGNWLLPNWVIQERTGINHTAFSILSLQVTHCYSHQILLMRIEPPKVQCTCERRWIRLQILEWIITEDLWTH